MNNSVLVDRNQGIVVITINRPDVRNAVDVPTAEALVHAFREYDRDDGLSVAVLTGAAGTFCAGADLKAIAAGERRRWTEDAPAPAAWSSRSGATFASRRSTRSSESSAVGSACPSSTSGRSGFPA